jgi:hypothetical protein
MSGIFENATSGRGERKGGEGWARERQESEGEEGAGRVEGKRGEKGGGRIF